MRRLPRRNTTSCFEKGGQRHSDTLAPLDQALAVNSFVIAGSSLICRVNWSRWSCGNVPIFDSSCFPTATSSVGGALLIQSVTCERS